MTSKKYKEAGIRLQMVAAQIIGVLQFREDILISARQQGAVEFVIFEVRPICKDCTAPPEELVDHLGEEVPAPDPAHYLELDHLIEFAQGTVARLWSGSIQRKPFPAAFRKELSLPEKSKPIAEMPRSPPDPEHKPEREWWRRTL